MTHPLLAAAAATPPPVVVAASSGSSWTEIVAALGAAVAAGATLIAATAAIFALVFARRAARAAGEQATAAKAQVDAAQAQVAAAQEQTRQAGELEWQRSQPHVVVYADVSVVSAHYVDLIITNLGSTGARDVVITCEPPLVRSVGGASREQVALPEQMPFLAPGQQWRTLWDFAVQREGAGLPDRFEVTATYADSRGQQHVTTSVLDWRLFRGRRFVSEKGVHDAAKSLAAIQTTLSAWSQREEVVRVATYDGPGLDKQQAADARRSQRQHEALVGQVMPDPDEGPVPRMDGTTS